METLDTHQGRIVGEVCSTYERLPPLTASLVEQLKRFVSAIKH